MKRVFLASAFIPFLLGTAVAADQDEIVVIPRVEKMPNIPSPFEMRDWKKVTRDYLDLVLDFDRKGEHLPIVSWKDDSRRMVFMPAYVGAEGGPESINYIAAVISGSLVGLDMTRHRGLDWVRMSQNFFSKDDGVYTDALGGRTGGSFWYDALPNVLFFQLCDLYPGDAERDSQLLSIAEKWRQACAALGAKENPPALPDFDHTAFNLRTMAPYDNGLRIEPEGGAGIA
jgi:hypothetical protein